MKIATSRTVTSWTVTAVGSAVLVLLLGLVGLAPHAVARTHETGHPTKPHYLSCKPLVDYGAVVKDVTDETGIAPEMGPASNYRHPVGKGSVFRHVPSTECDLHWLNDIGNSSAYGNCGNCGEGVWETCAAIGVSKHDFKATIPKVGVQDGGVCSSVYDEPFSVQKYSPAGHGSLGYVIVQSDEGGTHPIDYNVYAWTKKEGCFVSFDAWPLSLEGSETYVNKALSTC